MTRFELSLPELEIVCLTAVRQKFARLQSLSITSVYTGFRLGDWEVTQFLPTPPLGILHEAMQVVREIHQAFALKPSE